VASAQVTLILYNARNLHSVCLFPHRTLILDAEPEIIVGAVNIAAKWAMERKVHRAIVKIKAFLALTRSINKDKSKDEGAVDMGEV